MKVRVFSVLLVVLLLVPMLSGCGLFTMAARVDAAEEMVENRIDAAEDALENAAEQAILPENTNGPKDTEPTKALTKEEAEAIALKHAGFTSEQVNLLRTEYEIDDGIPQYEIEFRQDFWEYDYTIHAETGVILSYDKDD